MCFNRPLESDSDSMPELQTDSDDDFDSTVLRGKWMFDGANNLDEVIEKLNRFIQNIQQLKIDGWELIGTIDDDYGIMRKN